MKKSKVIIPAMAMILFSTAASISGTVAWFTASRVFTTTVGNFSVKNIDGNLEAVMLPGVGTEGVGTATDGTYGSIKVKDNCYLLDGSFDHSTRTAYRLSRDTDGFNSFGALNTGSATETTVGTDAHVSLDAVGKWLYRSIGADEDTSYYYIAMSWQIKFSYTFNAETANVGIYLDLDATKSVISDVSSPTATPEGTHTEKAIKGFRIAFCEGGHDVVWGGKATNLATDGVSSYNLGAASGGNGETHANKYTYVNGTAKNSVGDYVVASAASDTTSGVNFLSGQTTADTAPDNTTGTARADRVATILKSSADTTTTVANKTITCVAWFEGTDPNVVNGTAMQVANAKMTFYAKSDAA